MIKDRPFSQLCADSRLSTYNPLQLGAAARSSRIVRRHAEGGTPIIFLNARLKAASDS
jgi:hypothetical protein